MSLFVVLIGKLQFQKAAIRRTRIIYVFVLTEGASY